MDKSEQVENDPIEEGSCEALLASFTRIGDERRRTLSCLLHIGDSSFVLRVSQGPSGAFLCRRVLYQNVDFLM